MVIFMDMKCQVCSSESLHEVMDMGHHPPSDSFLTKEELDKPETLYPLKLFMCNSCSLVQLSHAVDPKILFTEKFIYRTGYSNALKKDLQEMIGDIVKRFGVNQGDFVVDIGSNDGTMLGFYPHGVRVLGVDPSSVADIAIQNGVPTIKDFFNENLSKQISEKHGKAKVITSTNTFAHVKDIWSLMNGIKALLGEKGVFVQGSHYFLDMVEKMQHDEIYLEHLRYYSVESLVNLFKHFGMDVFYAKKMRTHGGSIVTAACLKGEYPIDTSVDALIKEEKTFGLHSKDVLGKFKSNAFRNRAELVSLLHKIKKDGKKVVGIGAAAKGVSLLNFCKIGPELVDYIVERSDLKIGKFTPGMHIPIIDEKVLFEDQPEYALLLAWNLKDDLIPKLRGFGYKGKFILPNPAVEVIE